MGLGGEKGRFHLGQTLNLSWSLDSLAENPCEPQVLTVSCTSPTSSCGWHTAGLSEMSRARIINGQNHTPVSFPRLHSQHDPVALEFLLQGAVMLLISLSNASFWWKRPLRCGCPRKLRLPIKAKGVCGGILSWPLSHSACVGEVSHPSHHSWQKCDPNRTRPESRDPLDITRRRDSQGNATPVYL